MNEASMIRNLPIAFDRDLFLRKLIRELAGTLEDIVGYDEAASYISVVGQNIGEWINKEYTQALGGAKPLTRGTVAEVLVDLKARIQGSFSVVEQNEGRIVLENHACPFAEMVLDHPSMCMMTSNVFGVIAAENLGYARVSLEKTIARRDPLCLVVVHLKPSPETVKAAGREYFRSKMIEHA